MIQIFGLAFLFPENSVKLTNWLKIRELFWFFSSELLEEFIDVVSRPKFKKYFSKKDIEKILEYFDQFGELVKVNSDINICRDSKDNFLLTLSVDSKADYLITGDKDLLILEKIEHTTILTFSEFIEQTE